MIAKPCKYSLSALLFIVVLCVALPSARASTESRVLAWLDYYNNKSQTGFQQTYNYLKANPDWPARTTIQLHAEKHLDEVTDNRLLLQWFEDFPPLTADAVARYLEVLVQTNRGNKATAFLQNWWVNADLTRDQQKEFYTRYKDRLNMDVHKRRMNALLYKGDEGNAMAMANVLGGDYPKLAAARLALAKNKPNLDALVDQVPAALQNDPGLIYERLRWRRSNDLDEGAIALLAKAPAAKDMHDPGAWWRERHILVRRLMEEKKYKQAYQLAAAHHQEEGFPLAQAEWVCGFLALEFTGQPWNAFEHFEKLYKSTSTPISRSRGAYWAGRASDALKHPEVSQKWYEVAAQFDTTFYGQLAKAKAYNQKTFAPKKHDATYADINFYDQNDLAEAARILKRMQKHAEAAIFLAALRSSAQSPLELQSNGQLAHKLGYDHLAIAAAMEAYSEYGILFTDLAYPQRVSDVDDIDDVEWALIHSLIRQESRFDPNAISHAGARGLMQIMPATADMTARKLRVRHSTGWLTAKPDHNIHLGSRYMREMLDRFDNNYAMAAAAYNAGPNRVDRWLEENGDPRKGEIDLITWIELIPIYETRNYAQRVLEGVYVYRELLKGQQPEPVTPIHVASR